MHKHILKFSEPKSLKELSFQIMTLVDKLYEVSYGSGCLDETFPVAMPLRLMLCKDNLLHKLSKIASQRLNEPRIVTAHLIIGTLGSTARINEIKWMKDNCPDDTERTPDWVNANICALSWSVLMRQHLETGLGCNCAFCGAVYVSANVDFNAKDNNYNLEPLHKKLFEIKECDKSKCCHTIMDKLSEANGWVVQEVEWDGTFDPPTGMGGRN